MKKEFRIELLKKMSELNIQFQTIVDIANKGKRKKDRVTYQIVYNVLNGRQNDKNQRVLNATLKAISQAKADDEITDHLINSL